MILRGTGLNFGNDPFATVGEGGDTRIKGRRRRRLTKGLKGRMKGKIVGGKREEREEALEGDRLDYSGGGSEARAH